MSNLYPRHKIKDILGKHGREFKLRLNLLDDQQLFNSKDRLSRLLTKREWFSCNFIPVLSFLHVAGTHVSWNVFGNCNLNQGQLVPMQKLQLDLFLNVFFFVCLNCTSALNPNLLIDNSVQTILSLSMWLETNFKVLYLQQELFSSLVLLTLLPVTFLTSSTQRGSPSNQCWVPRT